MHSYTFGLCLGAFAALGCSTPQQAAPEPNATARPNIVLFLVDDLGWQDLAVPLDEQPTPFNKRYRTPHLQRLARE
ncbi:MAG: hypothetical protein ACI87O_002746, partial [Planctomycetota bacterium]